MGETTRVRLSPILPSGPSPAGHLRYPDSNGYYRLRGADGTRFPCVCEPTCAAACTAECSCFACRIAASDRKSAEVLRVLRERQSVPI